MSGSRRRAARGPAKRRAAPTGTSGRTAKATRRGRTGRFGGLARFARATGGLRARWRRLGPWLRWPLGLAGAAFAAVLALQLWYLASVTWWAFFDPGPTPIMVARLEALREEDPDARLRHDWVPYQAISVHAKRAVIAAEDARFLEHGGIDWEAIGEAFEQNLERGRIVRGGSTITMQLAKNLLLSESRSYVRKAQELVIAWMLESVLDKRRILELYLNVAEWGVGVFGIEAAARHHYGIGADGLGAWQAARLAAMLPNPRHYDRNPDSARLARRTAAIARWMRSAEVP